MNKVYDETELLSGSYSSLLDTSIDKQEANDKKQDASRMFFALRMKIRNAAINKVEVKD